MHHGPVSSIDLAAAVAEHPCPLIFLDTAAILDILRVPCRSELQVDIIDSAATTIDDLVADPRRIWVVTSANVIAEFQANRESVRRELATSTSNLNESFTRLSSIAKVVLPEWRIEPLGWLNAAFQGRILGIMDRLVAETIVFRGSKDCTLKAAARLKAGLAPASRSKQEFKDCEIFEEFLELISAFRKRGFNSPAGFVTPNSKDYGQPPDGNERIACDLQAHRALYAANIAWARVLVG
jgi:hypothetical protein